MITVSLSMSLHSYLPKRGAQNTVNKYQFDWHFKKISSDSENSVIVKVFSRYDNVVKIWSELYWAC